MRAVGATMAAIGLLSCSAPVREADIAVRDGWMRETGPGQAGAIYLVLENDGDGADRLVGVESPAAAATLHSSTSVGGVARMRPLRDGLELPARSTVELKPGGIHIMLTGLKQPLKAGQTTPLNLRFARSREQSIAVRVVSAGSGEGAAHAPGM